MVIRGEEPVIVDTGALRPAHYPGAYDPTKAAMWIVDSLACPVPSGDAVYNVRDVPRDLVDEFCPCSTAVSPWHQWLDPEVYRRHVDDVEALGLLTVASAHGPVMAGDVIHEELEVIRNLAGKPIIPAPGQELLDELVAQILAGQAA